jgi:PAS domain S-box-containing protein
MPATNISLQSPAGFEALYRHAPIGILALDETGLIESANSCAEKMFGYMPGELVGKNHEMLLSSGLHEKHREHIHNYFKDAADRSMGTGLRLNGYRKDSKSFPTEIGLASYEHEGKKIVLAFVNDISNHEHVKEQLRVSEQNVRTLIENTPAAIEDRLRNYATDLEHVVEERTKSLQQMIGRLETTQKELTKSLEKEKELGQLKSRFVSMASHEFRTPLTTILLSANLIDKYANLDNNPHISQHTRKIKKATFNLTGILDDFLSLEKLETGHVRPIFIDFDVVKFAKEVTEEMQLAAKQEQQIIYTHTGGKSMVHLDSKMLKNCIINLISNAIKYSGEKTVIEFETSADDRLFKVVVRDNGIGIPETEQKHLFEAFFRAHNTGSIPGTGLGLNIVARYVKLMHGHIEFKSEVNKGTCFELTFPQSIESV